MEGIAKATGKLPLALQNRPEATERLQPYIEAFRVLSKYRDERGKITFSDTIRYSKELGETRTLDFADIISRADKAFIETSKESKNLMGK